jgi:3-oxoacyl-[acyl-carrier-protein] synthase II
MKICGGPKRRKNIKKPGGLRKCSLPVFFKAYEIMISANKSMIGHMWGAAGAVEGIFTAKTVQEGIIPPTLNLDEADPKCDLDYVPHKARRKKVHIALSNSFGFGGINASLVFKRYER